MKDKNVLIVDDEPRFTQSLGSLLGERGLLVRTSLDGDQALRDFRDFPARVVITDIEMPGKNGFDLTRELAELDEFVQIIFLTGHANLENTKKAFQKTRQNTFEFFKKPLGDINVLFRAVESALFKYQRLKAGAQKRKKAEKTLAATGRLFDSLEALIFVSDMDTCEILYSNSRFNQELGYDPGQSLSGGKCWQVIHKRGKGPCRFCTNKRIVDQEGRPTGPYEWEFENKSTSRRYSVIDKAIVWHDKRIVRLSTLYDITEKRKYEELFKSFEKTHQSLKRLESIGTLAGGIAHQFNNALSVIAGNLELIEMEFPHERKLVQYTRTMQKSAQKMAGLTASLLAYARGGKYKTQTLVFSDILEEILEDFGSMLSDNTRTIKDICSMQDTIRADKMQLQMLLTAVLENALEAGSETIKISCRRENPGADLAEVQALNKNGYLCLKIEDDGLGMSSETLESVYEPFFTTKFQGRGLGLSAAYGIVKSHQGFIHMASSPGKGTRVKIFFPLSNEVQDRDARDRCTEAQLNILLVEDKDDVRSSTRVMLEKLGHNIFEAGTGHEAIRFVKSYKNSIHLALLDYLLPDVNGDIVYPQLVQTHPETEVVILNGYAMTDPIRKILETGTGSFMQKPVTMDELSEKISQITSC